MNLYEDIYDGELNFEIENLEMSADAAVMDLVSEYKGEKVGLKVSLPLQTKRVMFKNITMLAVSKPIIFTSVGESSDRLVAVLDKIWNPDFEVEGKFSSQDVEIEYTILNREMFDCTKEKVYTRLYANIDMQTGDEFDNINMELGFNFNLDRKRASFVELKKVLRNDFLALIME